MTDAEWIKSENLDAMLRAVPRNGGYNRKSRLFACACYRSVWEHIGCPHVRETVGKAEERADRRLPQRELERYRYGKESAMPGTSDFLLQSSLQSLVAQNCNAGFVAFWVNHAFSSVGSALVPADQLRDTQLTLLRDIYGNPFRQTISVPEWRTDTAVAIARQMYEAREFSAMPILADALQDAGCGAVDILDHCRDPQQVHARGCWVVDLVLGKV